MNQYNPTLLLSLLVSRDHAMATCEAWDATLPSQDDSDPPDDFHEVESNGWHTRREPS
jgi:hypothetical protein